MSADVIGMIIALFAFTVSVLGGVEGMLGHQTKRIDTRFDKVDERLEAELTGVKGEIVEVKVAVARLEGPRPHLQRI